MWSDLTRQLVEAALFEDLGRTGDISSSLLPDSSRHFTARVTVRQPGVICGLALAPLICEVFATRLNAQLQFEPASTDGTTVLADTQVASVYGPRSALLTVERTLLNFMCRLSGIATMTRRYVDAAIAVNPRIEILDTRKTIPGWRELDKYAVRCGGGRNHRFGLHDAVLIKDNHFAGIPAPQLADALRAMLAPLGQLPPARRPKFIEVEVDNLDQFAQVSQVENVDIVLLDNFTPDQMRAAVVQRNAAGRSFKLEASGGITLERVAEIAGTGIDRISMGALTHSAPALDIALDA